MKPGFIKRKCPKCGGNLYFDCDYYVEGSFFSWYKEETCLQCGFTCGTQIPLKPVERTATAKAIPAVKKLVHV